MRNILENDLWSKKWKKTWYDKYIFYLILFMKYSDIYVVYFYPDSTEMSILR